MTVPDSFFPFHALGFSRNPFGDLTSAEWADIAVLPVPASVLLANRDHLQFIGPKGCGKTSHLLALAAHLAATGRPAAYERLAPGQRRFGTRLAGLDCFLLDEAQRLGPFARGALLRAAANGLHLVLGTHADLAPHARRHGLRFTTRHLAAHTTPDHLAAVIDRRLAHFALHQPTPITLAPDAVIWLWSAYGANLRAVENFLYEVFQALTSATPPLVLTASDLARLVTPPPLSLPPNQKHPPEPR